MHENSSNNAALARIALHSAHAKNVLGHEVMARRIPLKRAWKLPKTL
jgi:hypothetical protein